MPLDYPKMIKALFGFRDQLHNISNSKNQKLVDYFRSKEMDLSDHDLRFPETTEIAKSIGLSRHKVTALVQDLYVNMVEYFSDNSMVIKDHVQVIYIHFPYDEENTIHKGYREEAKQKALWFQVQLPAVPRLGEEIALNFIENDIKYDHGYVTEIAHEISCLQQRTIIHVHPLKNYFHQWDKLRVRHEFDVKAAESQEHPSRNT